MRNRQIFGIIVIVLMLCLIAGRAYTAANDYPHNGVNNIGCDSCHLITSATTMVDVTGGHTTGLDDSLNNNVCWGCHNDVDAPQVQTHSYLQTDDDYGEWSVECSTCHNPHTQRQVKIYTTDTYLATGTSTSIVTDSPTVGESTLTDTTKSWTTDEFQDLSVIPNTVYRFFGYKILSNTADTLTVEGVIDSAIATGDTYAVVYGKIIKETIATDDILVNTPTTKGVGDKTVKFLNNTGTNSFADTGTDYDGICEACHTQTYWHRNNPTGDHAHNNELNCTTQCHKHTEGFKGTGCNVCHGFPPISNLLNSSSPGGNTGLVEDPGTTGSTIAGVHDTHVNTKDINCTFCHFNSDGIGATHNDGSPQDITIGFSLFGGAYLGGTYDGQTTATYDSSEGNTTVINTGSMSCNNIYCHGKLPAGTVWGGGAATIPIWDGSVPMTCTSCHDEGGSTSILSYKHSDHTNASRYGFTCEKCHYQTATGSTAIKTQSYHANNVKDVIFSAGGAFDSGTKACTTTYCHSDAAGGVPNTPVEWDSAVTMACDSCHNGRTGLDTLEMISNGHNRLTSSNGSREYPCYTCHNDTMDSSNVLNSFTSHVNETKDIVLPTKWHLFSEALPTYDSNTKVCDNFYCHSDGTTVDPEIKPYPWTDPSRGCNACHGHSGDCADCHTDITGWAEGDEWKSAMPMYTNEGPGLPKSNSHVRHVQSDFTCNECHKDTVLGGACLDCHTDSIPAGSMFESGHVDTVYHINKTKDVVFAAGGSYDPTPNNKTCTSTQCHTGADPQWGDSVTSLVICKECHGDTSDVDDFVPSNDIRGKINMDEFTTTGHGRLAASGAYPESGNPAANFPGNPCWYCHDNDVLHNDYTNPFRLKQHDQFDKRFEKECVYCHMEGFNSECLSCHNTTENTLAPQLIDLPADSSDDTRADGTSTTSRPTHMGYDNNTDCLAATCHGDGSVPIDGWTHYSKAGLWEDYEINDVKNQYMMMGVCLKCHDDDSNGKCTDCHDAAPDEVINGGTKYIAILRNFSTADDEPGVGVNWATYWSTNGTTTDVDNWEVSEAYTTNKFELGYDPSTGFVVAAQARASSVHFGYKHYAAYETSFDVQADSGAFESGSTTKVVDADKNWTPDIWTGDYVMVTSGANNGEYRRILNNTADTLTMAEVFTNAFQLGDTYYLNDPVWKGGKFCWDCHDPHGDTNIFMIQDEVSTETDGTFGTPVSRRTVSFTQKATGMDYVDIDGPTYDGICNVCHTEAEMHYRYDYGDGHNLGRICTDCHEHKFTDSHASGLSCSGCHGAKPVPRHSGFGLPKDCTKCHAGIINKRVDIVTQLSATNSHHIQGVTVTNKHCYACHWEAMDIGLINVDYHSGYNFETHVTVKNAAADLVIWGAGTRPTTYVTGDIINPENNTATTFTAANIGTVDERTEVENVTLMCLGCHSEQNNDFQPFNIVDDLNGDCKTPNQYAWDGTSIAERYSQKETTTWGKYETVPDAAQKNIQKAFSAHGNAVNNAGGWSGTTGLDGTIPNTRAGTENVQCFDCHSSHGSRTTGITSSYATFNGTYNGANLKETQAGKGGYFRTYKARANPDPDAINPYNEGAAQCFDCHQTETVNTELYPGNYSPWGYADTFGADTGIGIMGYKDTPYFDQGTKASTARFAYRATRATMLGGHLHASKPVKDLGTSTSGDTTTVNDTSKSWTTDQWTDYFVLMKSGNNDGVMRKITSNTSTQLTVYAFDNTVGTDDYEIVQPMVKETGTASGGDTITVDDSTKAWTIDEWAGYFVLMQSGNNLGNVRRVTSNTSTQLAVGEFANNVASGDSYEIVPYAKTIKGLCTPCHDPHGVSPTLGENQRYGVPLLKGTWMTSPYKEDYPPIDPTGNCADQNGYAFNVSWGRSWCLPSSALYTSTYYQIDRNTFSFDRITEDDQKFAGLCLRCHPKENLTDGSDKNTDFRTKDRIHESVQGWGENTEHSWPCSKCHQPHVSGLPRLMQTNCLDYNHRGERESGGVAWSSHLERGQSKGKSYMGYPSGYIMGNSSSYKAQNMCHTQASDNYETDGTTPKTWPDTNRWNNVTPW